MLLLSQKMYLCVQCPHAVYRCNAYTVHNQGAIYIVIYKEMDLGDTYKVYIISIYIIYNPKTIYMNPI